MRESVRWFAEKMEETLKKNDYKGGWETCSKEWLLQRLKEEVDELYVEILGKPCSCRGIADCNHIHIQNKERIISEATDVANIAMMIADITNKTNYN